jgi:hypothetical protein
MFLLVSKIRVPFTQGFPIITSGSTLIPAGSFIRVVCPITADALKLLQVRDSAVVIYPSRQALMETQVADNERVDKKRNAIPCCRLQLNRRPEMGVSPSESTI